uniref:Sulfatase N-terminal domain-containing protein n=1 Tax=Chaetoceros debilis TaxID=122233 RepID=A0A7S3PVI5_9STRA|mmetsp:Transcript_20860/g.31684  ORF Transcript_20860/g.31684 Transcript_20860/m.31684 type:complete len:147 (+) Transcript_20860:905-1345(+)
MTNAIDRDEKFAIVLSIPDPHGPNQVRKPYDTMYADNKLKIPESGKAALRRDPATPGWNVLDYEDVDAADAEAFLEKFENGRFYQNYMQQYFGMVKCIDENVGKLLGFLEEKAVDENTIVIFTSGKFSSLRSLLLYQQPAFAKIVN